MKKISQKIVEAGLVPRQTLSLMKYWGLVPDEATEADVSDTDKQRVQDVVDEIAGLLDEEKEIPELRETSLDLDTLFKGSKSCEVVILLSDGNMLAAAYAVRDRLGNFIFQHGESDKPNWTAELVARPGNRINWDHHQFEIVRVRVAYEEDWPKYYVCSVQEVPEHATLRFVRKIDQ